MFSATVRFGTLSIADRRLTVIARGLAAEARLLVLDEPTASLTDEEITHLHEVIRLLRDQGVAIIYVTHRLQEVFDVTDDVAVMRDGRMVFEAPTASVDRRQLIEHITGTKAVATTGRWRGPAPDPQEQGRRRERTAHPTGAAFRWPGHRSGDVHPWFSPLVRQRRSGDPTSAEDCTDPVNPV